MASYVQNLFIFNTESFDNQGFFNHVYRALQASQCYGNLSFCYTLHLPNESEDFYDDNHDGWDLEFIFKQLASSPHGGFFDMIYLETHANHGCSLHINNIDNQFYMILDWRVTQQSIQLLDEMTHLLKLNQFLKADSIYSSTNWLNSASFAERSYLSYLASNQANKIL